MSERALYGQRVKMPGRENLNTWLLVAKGFDKFLHPVGEEAHWYAIASAIYTKCIQGNFSRFRSFMCLF